MILRVRYQYVGDASNAIHVSECDVLPDSLAAKGDRTVIGQAVQRCLGPSAKGVVFCVSALKLNGDIVIPDPGEDEKAAAVSAAANPVEAAVPSVEQINLMTLNDLREIIAQFGVGEAISYTEGLIAETLRAKLVALWHTPTNAGAKPDGTSNSKRRN